MNSSPDVGLVLVTGHLDSENPAYIAIQNFIDIYEEEARSITILGPASTTIQREKVDFRPISRQTPSNTGLRIVDYIHYQFQLAKAIYDARTSFDVVFFHLGGRLLILPILMCKFSNTPSVVFVTGPIQKGYSVNHGESSTSKMITPIIDALEYTTNKFADRIVLLSKNMKSDDRGVPAKKKVIANLNYINCEEFVREKPVNKRSYDIVFVGRLERVKGVENLVHAISRVVEDHPDVRINLIGDGNLRDELQQFVKEENLSDNVDFSGWVEHEKISDHLNEGRLLVLPSRSEGVPKALLEAMACGTVPVATEVGGIPDIIESGKNGFLLDDNGPDEIATVITKLLSRDDLERISKNAQRYVSENHSFESVREKYRIITEETLR